MSPLSQARLLMPLLDAIRGRLAPGEYAPFRRTIYGSPCIEVHTEHGGMIATIDKAGLYALDTAGSRYVCDPNAPEDAIYDVICRALNDARKEWA